MANEKLILITGGSGFIGRSLAKRLSSNYKIIALDRDEPSEKILNVEYKFLDIASKESVECVLEGIRTKYGSHIQSVIHLAAFYSFSGKKSPEYRKITVEGTKTLLTALNRLFTVEQFIFSSTMLVHAPTELGKEIDEYSPVVPSWPYPESKVEAEKIIRENRGKTPAVNLRISGVYDDYGHSIPLAQHIARIFEKQLSSMLFPGDSANGQAFLHIDDLVDAVELIVEKCAELPPELTLLLGEDKPLSYKMLQARIGELLHGKPWPTFRIPKFVAKLGAFFLGRLPVAREPFIKPWMVDYADEHYDLDIRLSEQVLRWRPKRSLFESLSKITAALKNNPKKWYHDHKIKKPSLRTLEPLSVAEENAYKAAAFVTIFSGIWLISNPFTLGYNNLSEFWSDLSSGVLILIFAVFSMAPSLRWLRWFNCIFASWLMAAPLVFWTTSAAIYSNDTLLGAVILLASAYTPAKPSESDNSASLPQAWTYNPSSWSQRLPIMLLALIGFLLARYLAAFQLGHIPRAWDPFFGNGTETVLKSAISKEFPVADAGLGALSYLLDLIAATIGSRSRWRTMPWIVILFGLFIIPTGAVSIVLVMLQPIGVGAWCSICLLTSVIMLIMVPPAIDEVAASVQFLRQSQKAGRPFWRTFWFGNEALVAANPILITPSTKKSFFPWHLIVSAILGTWLLFMPWALNVKGIAASNLYVSGALVCTIAVIAIAPVARIIRLLNVLIGFWLCFSPWFMGNMGTFSLWHTMLAGFAIVSLSFPRGQIGLHFGTLDKWVYWTPKGLIRSDQA